MKYKVENIYSKQLEESTYMLYDEKKGLIHEVNEIAYLVFEGLENNYDVDHIVNQLSSRYQEVDKGEVIVDVEEIISSFVDLGIVQGQ